MSALADILHLFQEKKTLRTMWCRPIGCCVKKLVLALQKQDRQYHVLFIYLFFKQTFRGDKQVLWRLFWSPYQVAA